MRSFADSWRRLLIVPTGKRSVLQIILWWELRRILYNLVVGFTGLLGLVLSDFAIIKFIIENGDDPPGIGPVTVFLMNVSYTAGWVVEVTFRRAHDDTPAWVGPLLFKIGLVFSMVLVLMPSLVLGLVRLKWALMGR